MKITVAMLDNLFSRHETTEGQTSFKTSQIAAMLGVSRDAINKAIASRPALFPAPIIEGDTYREWDRNKAIEVVQKFLSQSPKARRNVLAAVAA